MSNVNDEVIHNSAYGFFAHACPECRKTGTAACGACQFGADNCGTPALVSHEVIIELIAATTTKTGLRVRCELDHADYAKGIKVPDKEMAGLALMRHDFHGDWNYTLSPQVNNV